MKPYEIVILLIMTGKITCKAHPSPSLHGSGKDDKVSHS